MKITWKGEGIDEKAFDEKGRNIVAIDKRYYRPSEVDSLLGDASKAKKILGWKPRISFEELVLEMSQSDLKKAEQEKLILKINEA